MKKLLIVALLIVGFSYNVEAAIFGYSKKKVDQLNQGLVNQSNRIESLSNKIDTNISALSDNVIKLNAELKAEIKAEMTASVNMKVQAGIDNSKQAARDLIQTSIKNVNKQTTNSPIIFLSIIAVMGMIIAFLIRSNFATRRWLLNEISSNNRHKGEIKELRNGGKK